MAEIGAVVPWARLVERLTPLYPKGEHGRPVLATAGIGLERMMRIYFVQQWYTWPTKRWRTRCTTARRCVALPDRPVGGGGSGRDGGVAEPADALPRYIAVHEAHATDLTRPYPGGPETLAELRRRGYCTAVCTNKLQQASETVLDSLGLAALFDAVAGGDRYKVKKPTRGIRSASLPSLAVRRIAP